MFYLIHHIVVKANLFFIGGIAARLTGSERLAAMGGLYARAPWLALLFAIPALSLAGIPPLSGFWAKFMVIDASFRGDMAWIGALALFVGLLTVFSMSKIWIEAFWKTSPRKAVRVRAVPVAMLAPIAALGLITLAIGFNPEPLVAFAHVAADTMTDPAQFIAAVFPEPRIAGATP